MKLRLNLILTICWLALQGPGFPQVSGSTPLTLWGDTLRREILALSPALVQGDYSAIDAAAARHDLNFLWCMFEQASAKQLGIAVLRPKFAELRDALEQVVVVNQNIVDHVRLKMSAVPGHAKIIGDRIEAVSDEKGYSPVRHRLIAMLGRLGSMESIQQLGRFLGDERDPDGHVHAPDNDTHDSEGNWRRAALDMHRALGDASPADVVPGHFTTRNDLKMLEWWKSDSSRPYREWTYEIGLPLPSPRPRPVAVAIQSTSSALTAPKSSVPAALEANNRVNLWVVGLGAALVIALVTWVVRRRVRRG